VAVLGVPGTGGEIGAEPLDDLLLGAGLEQRPERLGRPDFRVEERLWPVPVSLDEAISAVGRNRDALDPGAATELGGDLLDRTEPLALDLEWPAEILELPGRQVVEVEREDDDRRVLTDSSCL